MFARQFKLTLEQRDRITRERKKAEGRRLATYRKRTATKAEQREIADYLAREPAPRFYG